MKSVKQLTMTLTNEPGALWKLNELLMNNGINPVACSATTDSATGTVRMIVSDCPRSENILDMAGTSYRSNDVLIFSIPDHPGGLNAVLKALKNEGVNINGLYSAIVCFRGEPVMILECDKLNEAYKVLSENWINVIGEELYSL